MDDRSRVLTAAVLGATVGGLLGYLYLTANGQHLRGQLEPWLDDVVGEVKRVRETVDKARLAADESMQAFSDILGKGVEGSGQPRVVYPQRSSR